MYLVSVQHPENIALSFVRLNLKIESDAINHLRNTQESN